MAKPKKLPKKPKASASLAVWERYEDKIQEVKKYNAKLEADKKRKKSLIEKTKKMAAK